MKPARISHLTIGQLLNGDVKSAWVVVPNTPEDIGELIVWLKNWYCRGEA